MRAITPNYDQLTTSYDREHMTGSGVLAAIATTDVFEDFLTTAEELKLVRGLEALRRQEVRNAHVGLYGLFFIAVGMALWVANIDRDPQPTSSPTTKRIRLP